MPLRRRDLKDAHALARSASPVAAASVIAAAIGVIWWLLALGLAPPHQAGIYLAVLGTATLSAEVANLGAGYALIRFLPTSGGPLARTAFLAVTCSTVATALIGGALFGVLSSASGESPQAFIAVVAGLAFAHSWYALSDDFLLALGRQRWILVRTSATAVGRVALLLVTGTVSREVTWWMLAGAYSIPALVAVGATAMALWGEFFPGDDRRGLLPLHEISRVARYAGRSYSANLAAAASPNALPPIVTWQLGPTVAAQYGVMWLIAGVLMLVPHAISATNLARAARGEASVEGMVFRALTLVLAIQLPSVGIVLVAAPRVVPELNSAYEAVNLPLLAPLLAGVVCMSLTSQLYSRARLSERHVRLVTRGQWLQAIMVLAGTFVLLPPLGLMGVSISWLVGAMTTLAFVALSSMRMRTAPVNEASRKGRADESSEHPS